MKLKMSIPYPRAIALAFISTSVLTGCAPTTYYEVPVPSVEVGNARDGAWRPYPVREGRVSIQPVHEDNWRQAEITPVPDNGPVYREDLPKPYKPPVVSEPSPLPQHTSANIVDRVQPVDPPKDWGGRRRTYSSRPEAQTRSDAASGSYAGDLTVRSSWADKAVRKDNRGNFDQMAKEAARHGKGQFEDEAGRKYFGESIREEKGCKVISVTVTGEADMPVTGSGLAYVCR